MSGRPGTSDITISGNRETIVLDFNALAAYEGLPGFESENVMAMFFEVVAEAGSKIDPETVKKIIKAQEAGEEIDPSEVHLDVPVDGSTFFSLVQKLGARRVRALFWAGLLHSKPRLTLEAAGKLFNEVEGDDFPKKYGAVLHAVVRALMTAFSSNTPKKDPATANGATTAAENPSDGTSAPLSASQ